MNSDRCTSDVTRNTRCLQWVIPVVCVLKMFDQMPSIVIVVNNGLTDDVQI